MSGRGESWVDEKRKSRSSWLWCGHEACLEAVHRDRWDLSTSWLRTAMKSVPQRVEESEDMLSRYVVEVRLSHLMWDCRTLPVVYCIQNVCTCILCSVWL